MLKQGRFSNQAITKTFVVLLCLLPVAQLATKKSLGYGLAGLAGFGRIFEPNRLEDIKPWVPAGDSEAGYDGQFYAQIALDPTLRNPALKDACDNLAYRAQRIAMPAASYALGLGQPRWIVQVYGAINFAAWIALLVWFIKHHRLWLARDRQLAIAILWSTGTLISVSRALTDLPSLCLSVFAIQNLMLRPVAGGLLAAGSLLTKETALLSVLGFASSKPVKPWTSAIRISLVVMPLFLWLMYVWYNVGGNQAGYQNFTWPIMGWLEKMRFEWLLAWERFPRVPILEMLTPLSIAIQTLYLLTHPNWRSAWWRMGIGFALLSLFLAHPVWESHDGYSRVLLPMTFAFNMQLSIERQKHDPWWYWLGNVCLFSRALPGLLIWAIFEWYCRTPSRHTEYQASFFHRARHSRQADIL